MKNGLFRLSTIDWIKGLVVAVITSAFTYIGQLMNNPAFDLWHTDWKQVITIGLTAGLSYVVKNLFSTNDGAVLGIIGGNKTNG